jgi:hypothetical protein
MEVVYTHSLSLSLSLVSSKIHTITIEGLRKVLVNRFVDYVKPHHLYQPSEYRSSDSSSPSSSKGLLDSIEVSLRKDLYGLGFTYAHSLPYEGVNSYLQDETATTTTTVTTTTTTTVTYTTVTTTTTSLVNGLIDHVEESKSYQTNSNSKTESNEGIDRSRSSILNSIKKREYDLIIYGSIARGMPFMVLFVCPISVVYFKIYTCIDI